MSKIRLCQKSGYVKNQGMSKIWLCQKSLYVKTPGMSKIRVCRLFFCFRPILQLRDGDCLRAGRTAVHSTEACRQQGCSDAGLTLMARRWNIAWHLYSAGSTLAVPSRGTNLQLSENSVIPFRPALKVKGGLAFP